MPFVVSGVCMSVVNPLSFFVEEKLGLPHKLFSNMTMNELQSIVSSTSGENVLMRTLIRERSLHHHTLIDVTTVR